MEAATYTVSPSPEEDEYGPLEYGPFAPHNTLSIQEAMIMAVRMLEGLK